MRLKPCLMCPEYFGVDSRCKTSFVQIGESEELFLDEVDISINQCLLELGLFRLWVLSGCYAIGADEDDVQFGRRRSRRN